MEQSEKFALKWNNYQTHLTARFQNLQQLEEFTDVILYCEDKKIKAHKVILAAFSPYFQNIFEDFSHFQSAIVFQDVKYNDLEAIMRFIYTGEVEITQEMLPSFIKTAHMLKMHGLTNMKLNEKMPTPKVDESTDTSDTLKRIPTPVTDIEQSEGQIPVVSEIDIEQPDVKRVKTEPIDDSVNNSMQEDALNVESELIERAENILEIDREMAASWLPVAMLSASESQDEDIKPLLSGSTENSNAISESSEERRYECKICGKGFATYDRLRVHTDVHEGLTKCTVCGQTLSRKDSLRRHMKIKHPVVPYAPMKVDNSNVFFLGGPV